MKKKELMKLIESATDEQDIDSLVEGSDLAKSLVNSGLTLDAFKGKLKEKEFKAFFDGENDKYHNKALDTWKKNNLEKELEPFIKDKYPELVTDPMAKKLAELEKQLADEKAANARKDLLSQAMKYAADKKMPTSFIERCLAEDLDKTKEVIDSLANDWSKDLEAISTEKLKGASYVPGKGADGKDLSIGAMLAAKNNENKKDAPNPWGKE